MSQGLSFVDDTRYKTVSELARMHGIPESTVRSWRDRFSPFIPRKRTQDGWVYDVARFKEVYHLCTVWAKGPPRRPLEMVGWELAKRHPDVQVKVSEASSVPEAPGSAADTAVDPAASSVPSAPHRVRGPHSEEIAVSSTTQELITLCGRLDQRLAQQDQAITQLTEVFTTLGQVSEQLAEAAPRMLALLERQAAAAERSADVNNQILQRLQEDAAERAVGRDLPPSDPWWRLIMSRCAWRRLLGLPHGHDPDLPADGPSTGGPSTGGHPAALRVVPL